MSSPMKLTGAALLAVAALSACSDSSGPGVAGRSVAFQLATQKSTAAPAALRANAAGTETITLGSDVIVVSSVQVVLRRIEVERAGGTVCDTLTTEDDCEELKAGPVLVDLPLGAGATRSFTVAIDTGSYGKLKFEIHKPESGKDAAFLAQYPGFVGVSIKVTGTYNGTDFTYISDLDVEQEHEFNPPITVTDAAGANLTLFVDLAGWFANAGGTGLIDPATALKGQPNEGEVKSNIETSFNAFEDDNHDGGDDHGGQ
jgi:hypothetical protein